MPLDSEYYLKRFYDKLYDNLLFENKLKKDSILLSFFDIKSNVRYRALEFAAISTENIPEILLSSLIKDNLIRPSDEINKYTITAKGVWVIEKNNKKITEDSIIAQMDEKFFDVYLDNKTLSDKEKVILFSMISARAFSEEAPIDLKKDEYALDAWKRILDNSYNKLHEMKLIKKMNEEELYGKKGNEHNVSNLLRHTDSLPKKTKGLYKVKVPQKYYLDIYSDNFLSKEKLEYLINIIFTTKKNIRIETIDEISNFCLKIAYEEAHNIFNFESHTFISPDFDDVVKDALKEVLL